MDWPLVPIRPLDHLPLMGAGDAAALILKDRVLDYDSLNLRVGLLARYLGDCGFSIGDRVASWVAKGELACLMPLAAPRAGLVHVPINPVLKRAQVSHIMADSGARAIIGSQSRLATLEPDDCNSNVGLHDERAVLTALDNMDANTALPPSDADTESLCAILYTSGSTGRPKGVMLNHRNLWLGAVSVAHYLGLAADDRTLAVLPLSFDYGQNQLLSAWIKGGAVVPLDYLLPRDVAKAVARHQITTLAAVPPLWVQLTELDWQDAGASLRRLTNSGGALTRPLVAQLRGLFPQAKLFAMYGITEAFRSTYLDPALIDLHPTSMGKAIPFAEILVVRPDGQITDDDEQGELVHCGPLVSMGYWRDEGRMAERFRPAPPASVLGGIAVWSGDRVWRDAAGLLHFVGRDDAMIKTSGNRVSPTEIEEAAVASGHVAEACVVGAKDARLGEAVILFARGSGDDAGLRAHLKSQLPNFMQPAAIIWLDPFPRNANGKIDRAALSHQAQEWHKGGRP